MDGGFFFANVLHLYSKTCTCTLVGLVNRERTSCIYPSDRHVVLACKERLLANHLVNDPDAFAKKKLMSLRQRWHKHF